MYFKWMIKNNKIIKLIFSWLLPLLTAFPSPFFRKKKSEEENGGKGMGAKIETGNYAERLVFWEHGGHSVSVVVGEKDSWETPRAWKLGFCFNHSRRVLFKSNWRDWSHRLKVVFANTSCHIFTFIKTHYFPDFYFRIQDSAKCHFSDGCTDHVFNHFSMYKVIFISFIFCFWHECLLHFNWWIKLKLRVTFSKLYVSYCENIFSHDSQCRQISELYGYAQKWRICMQIWKLLCQVCFDRGFGRLGKIRMDPCLSKCVFLSVWMLRSFLPGDYLQQFM